MLGTESSRWLERPIETLGLLCGQARTVRDRLGQMLGHDSSASSEVGDGSGDAERAVKGADREAEFFDRGRREVSDRGIQTVETLQVLRGEIRVAEDRTVRKP